ncbi:MAG: hypothetical protein HN742_06970 [Lentisphaerae bacterium]|jgi:hypothetical protein|nr:hypothetical protein [Lentisphaerota bacterium]MBT4817988.1 hypothetical protein [Lentisphaerota bacterium]MBT5605587.1 hypothetical protein [Lentisphaerota bacterium]MBT7054859.1 hypothetical protein [Lentisphaerota bacterium]MBT7841594.1 hypothetical protein [Lentisphaerota bacterium]
MAGSFGYLEAKRMCIVFVRVVDAEQERVQLQCFRGRANVEGGHVSVIDGNGAVFPVPSSALGNILPSDGTKLLQDADYFVLVRTDDNIEFVSSN